MWLGGFSACSSVLLTTPVTKRAEGWVLTLGQVKEGPDDYIAEGGVAVASGKGEKLIWALLTVRSELGQEETFSYDGCLLDGKDRSYQPLVIDQSRHAELNSAADRAEAFNPGQERTRQLIYAYPKDQRPTRMKCGTIVLPIPSQK
jgi:hypothetical protein